MVITTHLKRDRDEKFRSHDYHGRSNTDTEPPGLKANLGETLGTSLSNLRLILFSKESATRFHECSLDLKSKCAFQGLEINFYLIFNSRQERTRKNKQGHFRHNYQLVSTNVLHQEEYTTPAFYQSACRDDGDPKRWTKTSFPSLIRW